MALVYVFVPNQVGGTLIDIQRTHRSLVYQAHLRTSAARRCSGSAAAARIYRCGTVMTEGFQVPLLAYQLGVHTDQVEASPLVAIERRARRRTSSSRPARPAAHTCCRRCRTGRAPAYRLALANRTFRVYEHCTV